MSNLASRAGAFSETANTSQGSQPVDPETLADVARRRQTADGTELRIDAQHEGGVHPPSSAQALVEVVGLRDDDFDDLKNDDLKKRNAPNEDELLLQAGQIAEHLRSHLGEMDRREQFLNTQLSALDEERRQMRLWVQKFEVEMLQRAARIKTREEELSAKITRSERLVRDLETQAADLHAAREELGVQRRRVREQVEQELAAEREEIQQSRAAVEDSRRLLAEQAEQNQREHEAAILESRRQLEQEWARLHDRVAADFEQERTRFELDRAAWSTQREAEQQRLVRERDAHDAEIRRAEAEIDSRKRALTGELERLRRDHETSLSEERRQFAEERDRTRQQLQQERTVFENRVRFQQESLLKQREELEAARTEFRREQQQIRVLNESREGQLILRRRQLARARTLLEEREQSLERERELLGRARLSFDSELDRDRGRLKMERETWSQERQAQRAELRRQQDMLTLHAENLEARRLRLDHLKAELEETHRSTLEMRMAVEEAWVQLCQSAGVDAARKRVEETRRASADYYRHLQESLAAGRAELMELRNGFEKQRDEFAVERQTLASWMSERDDALRLWEEKLRSESSRIELRDAAWRAARDRWNQEKIGAEEIIRDLLRQLSHLNDVETGSTQLRSAGASTRWLDDTFAPTPHIGGLNSLLRHPLPESGGLRTDVDWTTTD